MATAKRTTLRSKTGKKLYAVRNAEGQFKDIQSYKRAHAADLRTKSKAEKTAAAAKPKAAVKTKAAPKAKAKTKK